jgi:hypothetical protein
MIDLQDVNHSYSPPKAENTHLVVFTYMIFFDIYKTVATGEIGSQNTPKGKKLWGNIYCFGNLTGQKYLWT